MAEMAGSTRSSSETVGRRRHRSQGKLSRLRQLRLQDVLSSVPVTRGGIALCRALPPRMGYGLARYAATTICRRQPELYHTVKGNLRQVLGPAASEADLEQTTWDVFNQAGRAYYDFFRAVEGEATQIAQAISIPSELLDTVQTYLAQGQGVLILGTHMSNFDLAIVGLGAAGLPIQVLSLTEPNEGFRIFNKLRATLGLEIVPITPASLRGAVRRLRQGGLVLTALDRPVPSDDTLIPFFGKPAFLPSGPARLAMLGGARVFIGSCFEHPDHGYIAQAEEIELSDTGDRRKDVYTNACLMARMLEANIAAHPGQWLMFHPIWPEAVQS